MSNFTLISKNITNMYLVAKNRYSYINSVPGFAYLGIIANAYNYTSKGKLPKSLFYGICMANAEYGREIDINNHKETVIFLSHLISRVMALYFSVDTRGMDSSEIIRGIESQMDVIVRTVHKTLLANRPGILMKMATEQIIQEDVSVLLEAEQIAGTL